MITHVLFLQISSTDLVSLSKLEVLDLSGNASALPEPSAVSALTQLQELYLRLELGTYAQRTYAQPLNYNYWMKAYPPFSICEQTDETP
jgi:hypothetical protein